MDFHLQKDELLQAHHNHIFQENFSYIPNDQEEKLERILRDLISKDEVIVPTENFMTSGARFENSKLVEFLKPMPKGAHLHLHSISTGSFKKLSQFLVSQDDLYVWRKKEPETTSKKFEAARIYGTMKYFTKKSFSALTAEENKYWKEIALFSAEEIYELITMKAKFNTKDEKKKHKMDPWVMFQRLWNIIFHIMHAEPLYKGKNSFLYTILQDQFNSGVTYLEFRETACPLEISQSVYIAGKDRQYKKISIEEHVRMFAETVLLFQKENPKFIGAKLILCGHKGQSNEDIHGCIEAVASLLKNTKALHTILQDGIFATRKWRMKDFVGGFDLVGHEDGLRPIGDYLNELKYGLSQNIDLVLHAGETLSAEGFQLYDAMILGTKRLGHAYDLINHPRLMERVKAAGVVVECCPISNNVLGYVADMRNHNARYALEKSLLNHGVKVAISSDNPAMFHYDDVTYDFAVVTKSWGLSLMKLKKMVKESFDGAFLLEKDAINAKELFERNWQRFVQDSLQKYV
eukprot:maker-scaffold_33-snap-gene-3.79-mRNA-1 protein AED:0.22 eAED:0.29 QI:0/0/0/0.75/1/1/4/0/518